MKILDKIVEDKKIELKDLSSKIPVTLLEKEVYSQDNVFH